MRGRINFSFSDWYQYYDLTFIQNGLDGKEPITYKQTNSRKLYNVICLYVYMFAIGSFPSKPFWIKVKS